MTPNPDFISCAKTWLIAAGLAAALYVSTSAPGLIWGDSGDAQLRVLLGHVFDRVNWSRSHILFYLITWPFTLLGADPARTATIVSAAAGALTIGNVAVLARMMTRHWTAVIVTAAMFALGHSLWHLSTVAEVMTLSSALLSMELICVLQFTRRRNTAWFIAALFVNGLGLSTHNLAILTWPAYGVLVVACRLEKTPVRLRTLFAGCLAFLTGAAPVIGLFVHLANNHASAGVVLSEMLMGRYGRHVYNTSRALQLAARMMVYTLFCLPTPLIISALWRPFRHATWRTATWFAFFVTAFLVHFMFAVRYNVADQHVFMLPSYVFVTILAATGVDRLLERMSNTGIKVVVVAAACIAPAVYAMVPTLLRDHPNLVPLSERQVPRRDSVAWFLRPWHINDRGPETFARETFAEAPPNCILSIDSTLMPPLLYLQHAERLRRDVRIIAAGTYQPWFDEPFDIASLNRDEMVRQGRVYTVTTERKYWNHHLKDGQYEAVPHGNLFRIVHRTGATTPP